MTPRPPDFSRIPLSLIRESLTAWYKIHKRTLPWRQTRDPYAVWVSEVMLQQTQVKTVIPYYLDFMAAHPTVEDLAEARLSEILKSWEGLGYYARARNLHKAAVRVTDEFNGTIPEDFKAFNSLPGVGDYIASAVLSIAFGRPHAVVDGNVKRVLSRLFAIKTPVNAPAAHKTYKAAAENLLDRDAPATFNQALMELGALVCTPKSPKCGDCPVLKFCLAVKQEKTEELPQKIKKKKVPTHQISVGVVRKKDKLLITRRALDGLLGGLWEFPGGKIQTGESPEQACEREIREETGLIVRADRHLARVSHAYTHFKIKMDVFHCTFVSGRVRLDGPIAHKWVSHRSLARFAFPKANLKFIPLIRSEWENTGGEKYEKTT